MIEYMKVGPYGLEVDSRVLKILLDQSIENCMAVTTFHHNQIEDVEYVELERDPDSGHAPVALPIPKNSNK